MLVTAAHAMPAVAQSPGVDASVEAMSDERRRGISWSDGDPALRLGLSVPVTDGLSIESAATGLWGSTRHGGADGVIDAGLNWTRQLGGWRLSAQGRYHMFPGASGQDYGEVGAVAGFLLGPASIDFGAHYAPHQSAIGGDNLYLSIAGAIALPNTPFTLSGHVGRSSGDADDPARSARLRPDGTYRDHGIALDWYRGRWFAGLRYSGTSIGGPARRDAGDKLIARAGFSF